MSNGRISQTGFQGTGMGVGNFRVGRGGFSECRCPRCGYTETHTRGIPCIRRHCPNCGTQLTGN